MKTNPILYGIAIIFVFDEFWLREKLNQLSNKRMIFGKNIVVFSALFFCYLGKRAILHVTRSVRLRHRVSLCFSCLAAQKLIKNTDIWWRFTSMWHVMPKKTNYTNTKWKQFNCKLLRTISFIFKRNIFPVNSLWKKKMKKRKVSNDEIKFFFYNYTINTQLKTFIAIFRQFQTIRFSQMNRSLE